MPDREFEYDVAFSFHSTDERLASALNDRLRDRFNTFIYLERQKELAGRDGEKLFSAVFGQQARLVVALVRPEWGETPFTRIEQTAIRNRAFEEGYDFTLFIPTTKPAVIPPWLPRTRLYLGSDRFGLDGTAAVIEAMIQTAGGSVHEETVLERASRLERAHRLRTEQKAFTNSERGVRDAQTAFTRLVAFLQEKLEAISAEHPRLDMLRVNHRTCGLWTITGLKPFMTFNWEYYYANTLDGASLAYAIHSGPISLPGAIPPLHEGRRVRTGKFTFELFEDGSTGYVEHGKNGRAFSVSQMADHMLSSYIEVAETLSARGD
jgi:hypothetical protein